MTYEEALTSEAQRESLAQVPTSLKLLLHRCCSQMSLFIQAKCTLDYCDAVTDLRPGRTS